MESLLNARRNDQRYTLWLVMTLRTRRLNNFLDLGSEKEANCSYRNREGDQEVPWARAARKELYSYENVEGKRKGGVEWGARGVAFAWTLHISVWTAKTSRWSIVDRDLWFVICDLYFRRDSFTPDLFSLFFSGMPKMTRSRGRTDGADWHRYCNVEWHRQNTHLPFDISWFPYFPTGQGSKGDLMSNNPSMRMHLKRPNYKTDWDLGCDSRALPNSQIVCG